jgi:hypothetical protein
MITTEYQAALRQAMIHPHLKRSEAEIIKWAEQVVADYHQLVEVLSGKRMIGAYSGWKVGPRTEEVFTVYTVNK